MTIASIIVVSCSNEEVEPKRTLPSILLEVEHQSWQIKEGIKKVNSRITPTIHAEADSVLHVILEISIDQQKDIDELKKKL